MRDDLYISTNGSDFSLEASGATFPYVDTGLSASTQYWYRVTAVDTSSNTANSNTATDTTDGPDVTAPIITSVVVPATHTTDFNVPITTLTVNDPGDVAFWIVTTSSTKPTAIDPEWTTIKPTSYNVGGNGTWDIHVWAMDAYSNISDLNANSWDTCAVTVSSGTTYFSEDFEGGLPAAADANVSTTTGWDSNTAAKITLPDPAATGNTGFGQWDIFGSNPTAVYVGFAMYMGPNFESGFTTFGGTQKPVIFVRGQDDTTFASGERVITHMVEVSIGVGVSHAFRQYHPDHNIDRNLNKVIPTLRNVASTDVTVATDTITEPNHYRVTGDRFHYTEGTTGIGGLTTDTTYYVIFVDTNNFQLATSFANAVAGTEITLTSQGSGTHQFQYAPDCQFFPEANTGKWFWNVYELDMDNGVVSWYLTSSDGVYNVPDVITGHGQFTDNAGSITYNSVSCDNRLMDQFILPTSVYSPSTWRFSRIGYFSSDYTPSADLYYSIDDMIVASTKALADPPSGF